jgi:hypothetical protein
LSAIIQLIYAIAWVCPAGDRQTFAPLAGHAVRWDWSTCRASTHLRMWVDIV